MKNTISLKHPVLSSTVSIISNHIVAIDSKVPEYPLYVSFGDIVVEPNTAMDTSQMQEITYLN